jgi:RNA polymerase sigma-70 factor (ECF subfamily)
MNSKKREHFEHVYQDYFPMVKQMCLGFVNGDEDMAKDLAQEVFIIIWNKLESFEGRSSYKTWIYRITVNTCLQHIRKEKKSNELSISKFEHQLPNETPVAESDTSKDLYKAIGKLTAVDKLLIIMVLDGLGYENISEVMGINETNVRVKIHRIKKRLKKILENE